MGAEVRKGPAMQGGPGRVRGGTRLCAPLILAPDADINEVVSFYLLEPSAPCITIASRRLYALAAFYVYDLLRSCGPGSSITCEVLAAILRSSIRMREDTAERIMGALLDAGLLAECEPEVDAW